MTLGTLKKKLISQCPLCPHVHNNVALMRVYRLMNNNFPNYTYLLNNEFGPYLLITCAIDYQIKLKK